MCGAGNIIGWPVCFQQGEKISGIKSFVQIAVPPGAICPEVAVRCPSRDIGQNMKAPVSTGDIYCLNLSLPHTNDCFCETGTIFGRDVVPEVKNT